MKSGSSVKQYHLNAFKLIVLFLSIGLHVLAQKTAVYLDPNIDFQKGYLLFEKQQFVSARACFEKFIDDKKHNYDPLYAEAEYYRSICAMELFNKDAEILIKQFIAKYPESSHLRMAYFNWGRYNYRKKKYKEAIACFWAVDIYELTSDEKAELYFKRGYSYFELSQSASNEGENEKLDPVLLLSEKTPRQYVAGYSENAKADFYQIKDNDTRYTHPALYYYSHISYNQGNYETALTGFLNLKEDENFGPIVPYYITQIYYLQCKYDDAIKYANVLLTDTINTKRLPEIQRIIGESYYRLSKFNEAIPFLKKYESATRKLNRPDKYQLGFAYYKIADYENAINYFKEVISEADSLSQNSYYHLADCYIKTKKKSGALVAFEYASKLSFDPEIKESSLFYYACLSYELAFNPYSDAIKSFRQYIKLYPNSPRVDECYSYLVNLFVTGQNYNEALRSLESMKVIKADMKPVYQKVSYYKAVDLFNDNQLDSALHYFEKSLRFPEIRLYNATAYYWIGQIYYKKAQFENSLQAFKEFMLKPGAFSSGYYATANYNIGYCYYNLKEYENANLAFRKYASLSQESINQGKDNEMRLADANIRIGDCYYISRDYSEAIEYYSKSIEAQRINVDYALYQRAVAYGILKQNDKKTNDLLQLVKTYTHSTYLPIVYFDLAKTYLIDDKTDEASYYFNQVIEKYPQCPYVNQSLASLGLICFNKKEDDQALMYFDKLLRRDRNSIEAENALTTIRLIYTDDKKDIDGLQRYFKEINATISENALDSASFVIARNAYRESNYEGAIPLFRKYLQNFPHGLFNHEALFCKANSEQKSTMLDSALVDYKQILNLSSSQYTTSALKNTIDIYNQKGDFKNAASGYLSQIKLSETPLSRINAQMGLLTCLVNLHQSDSIIATTQQILKSDSIPDDFKQTCHLYAARSYVELNRNQEASNEYLQVLTTAKGEIKAEAEYMISLFFFQSGDYTNAKSHLFNLIKTEAAYPIWITKALILLADNYVAQKDNFQAKHTLKTVIESSDNADLIAIAQEKYNKIIELEKADVNVSSDDDTPKVEFKENSKDENKTLFNDK